MGRVKDIDYGHLQLTGEDMPLNKINYGGNFFKQTS
jgi:hypothetical protein